jgi:hypothetical protein
MHFAFAVGSSHDTDRSILPCRGKWARPYRVHASDGLRGPGLRGAVHWRGEEHQQHLDHGEWPACERSHFGILRFNTHSKDLGAGDFFVPAVVCRSAAGAAVLAATAALCQRWPLSSPRAEADLGFPANQ